MSELDNLIFKFAQRGRAMNAASAYIGKTETDGSITIDVPGRPSDVYVTRRVNGEATVSVVEFRGGARLAGYPVIVETDALTGREFTMPDGLESVRFMGERPVSYAPIHGFSHELNGGDPVVIQTRQLTDGLLYVDTGLIVRIDPFTFKYLGRQYKFGGDEIDLGDYLPPTSGMKAGIGVGLDMSTDPVTLGAVTGSEEPAAGLLTNTAIESVDFKALIPLWIVRAVNGQTASPTRDDFYDIRGFVSQPVPRSNYTATTAPTVNDDSGDGYGVGSRWYNLTTDWEYVLLDATLGAAVWRLTTITSAASLPIHTHLDASNGGTLSAAAIASGTLALARGGTNADLSATGGANQFVKQSSAGGALSVAAILSADLTSALTTPPAIGGTTPAAGAFTTLSATVTDAVLNSTTNVTDIVHLSSGTPTTSFGVGLRLRGHSSVPANGIREIGRIRADWPAATDASRRGRMVFSVSDASAERDVLFLDTTGTVGHAGIGSSNSAYRLYVSALGSDSFLAAINGLMTISTGANVYGGLFSATSTVTATSTSVYGLGGAVLYNPGSGGLMQGGIAGVLGSIDVRTVASTDVIVTSCFRTGMILQSATAAGTVRRAVGYYFASPSITRTPTNLNGFYLEDVTGGTNNYSIETNAGLVVFNQGGNADSDFRVEGDTDANLLFTDASADKVGIGTASPNNKLDVAGTVQMNGLRIDVTPTAETITPTHTITISVNGTDYKIPIVAA